MAGEVMTLLDYAASQKDRPLVSGFVNAMLDDDSPGGGMGVMAVFPTVPVDSMAFVVPRVTNEGSPLPTSRPINGSYGSGVATITQETSTVGNYGQDVQIDLLYLHKTSNYIAGADPRTLQSKMLAKRMNRKLNNEVINGNKALDPNGMNGLRYQVDAGQVISVAADIPNFGSYTNGMELWSAGTEAMYRDLISAFDLLLDSVGSGGKRIIIANTNVQRAFRRAMILSDLLTITKDKYDREFMSYRGAEIVNPGTKIAVETLDEAETNVNMILPNSYTFGTATDATEIYAVKLGTETGVVLPVYKEMDVRTVTKEATETPAEVMRSDIALGVYRFTKSAIAKLTGVIAV
jgi:hypothetical protein